MKSASNSAQAARGDPEVDYPPSERWENQAPPPPSDMKILMDFTPSKDQRMVVVCDY
jgi:hypothetical protein